MLSNPLEQPAPKDPIQRIHEFARDLAYGVATNLWTTRFSVSHTIDGSTTWLAESRKNERVNQSFSSYIERKWDGNPPSEYILLSLNYFTVIEIPRFLLTEKAFSLLDRPLTPPSVFISYKRDQSSTFALLVEARLKIAGNPNPFIDKDIVPGDDWHGRLEEVVQNCQYFVVLVGPNTLDSQYVRRELEWASSNPDCRIISIWHNCKIGDDAPEILRQRHAIVVQNENALEYENAISQLLNAMGYSTY